MAPRRHCRTLFLHATERRKPWLQCTLCENAEQPGVGSSSADLTGLTTGPETGTTTSSDVGTVGTASAVGTEISLYPTPLVLHGVVVALNKTGHREGNCPLSGLLLTDRVSTTSPVDASRSNCSLDDASRPSLRTWYHQAFHFRPNRTCGFRALVSLL